ncbi:MAG: glycosyltransferase family 39 protein [Planctomycetales bacterium]|nr:glycosyltransferase family 39 protein [Planctomycetales bacterium]
MLRTAHGIQHWTATALSLAALCFAGAQVSAFVRAKSLTYDETFYLNCTLQSVADGHLDHRLVQAGTAPLGAVAANLPVALMRGGHQIADPWLGEPEHLTQNPISRAISALVVLTSLAVMVGWIVARRQGAVAGALGAWLLLASPSMLGHGSLATTDAPFVLATVLALLAVAQFRHRGGLAWGAAVAVSLAIAFSTKYTGAFLGPVLAIALVWDQVSAAGTTSAKWAGAGRAIGKSLVIGIGVFFVAWALHGFQWVPYEGRTLAETPALWQPAPLHGLGVQLAHNQRGHQAYLMGNFSMSGWWYYYPATMLLKSTPAEWLLMVLAGFGVAQLVRTKTDDLTLHTFAIAGVVLMALAMRSRICIGQRYVLPVYPLLIVLGCCWNGGLSRRMHALALGLLVLVQVFSSTAIAPHQLAYFSPLIGTSDRSAFLVDSNLDWGQDLPALRQQLERLEAQNTILQYFGSAIPEHYGVHGTPLMDIHPTELSRYDTIAVSATFLQGGYSFGRDPFHALRTCQPAAMAGHSIYIYSLRDPAVARAVGVAKRREVPMRNK